MCQIHINQHLSKYKCGIGHGIGRYPVDSNEDQGQKTLIGTSLVAVVPAEWHPATRISVMEKVILLVYVLGLKKITPGLMT